VAVKAGEERNRFPALVLVLVLVDSGHYIFGRLLAPYLPPVASSFYYISLALIQVALYAAWMRRIDWRLLRDNLPFFLAIGFLIAASTSSSFAALFYIDPGTAALLTQSGTIFSLALGILWLKDRLTRGQTLGAALAVAGIMVISFQPGSEGSQSLIGASLVLFSAFTYALHAAIVKRHGEAMDFLNFFLFRMLATSGFLFLFSAASGELVWPQGWQVWVILLLTATINVTLSRALYYIVLRRMDLSVFTILLTLSPVVTILWSILLFGERPTWQGLVGGAAVISGVVLVTVFRPQNVH